MPSSKHAIFIDSQNLYQSTKQDIPEKNYTGFIADNTKLFNFLSNKFQQPDIYYFVGYLSKYKSMYRALESIGYKLMFKNCIVNKDIVKGNVDVDIAHNIHLSLFNYDKISLLSGDGDFLCVVQHLQNQNKFGKLIAPNIHCLSQFLIDSLKQEDIIYISDPDLRSQLEYIYTKK